MSKHSYLAIFRECKEGGYWAEFPDWKNGPIFGATDGKDKEEAMWMATDLLNLMCWEVEHSKTMQFPEKKASFETVMEKESGQFFMLYILADTEKYDIIMEMVKNKRYRLCQIRKARKLKKIRSLKHGKSFKKICD